MALFFLEELFAWCDAAGRGLRSWTHTGETWWMLLRSRRSANHPMSWKRNQALPAPS